MPAPLSRIVDEAALRHPDAPAARCGGEVLTYEQLACRANGLARVLLASGLERRGRVAVLLEKGLDVPVAFFGALASGAALVPIDPRAPVEQIRRILRSTGARHLVTEPGKSDLVRAALETCPEVATVVGLDAQSDQPRSWLPWTTVLAEAGDQPPPVETTELDPAYILHTSGSTGIPKLILHTHRSAMSFVDWAVAEYGLDRTDRLTNHSSHHTCFATFDYYAAARAGATTVILTPAEMMMPGSLSTLLERDRVSVWYSVPTALVHLSLRGDLEQRDMSALRWVLFAGETFPRKHLLRLMRQLPSARFSHVYGSTEVNVCTFYHLPAADDLGDELPIGRACSTAETLVVDEELRPVAPGATGELLVRCDTVMSGYWGDPETSNRVLVRLPAPGAPTDVYFRTGDRVRTLEDGNLAFVARADFQVKVRGHRVELEEVENALLALEPVQEAAAVALSDDDGSSTLRAAVVLGATDYSTRELLDELAHTLPSYALPTDIAVLDSLPRTPTGKVDRKSLLAEMTTQGDHARQ